MLSDICARFTAILLFHQICIMTNFGLVASLPSNTIEGNQTMLFDGNEILQSTLTVPDNTESNNLALENSVDKQTSSTILYTNSNLTFALSDTAKDELKQLDLNEFCHDTSPGLHCHPDKPQSKISCPQPGSDQSALEIQCSEDYYCRSHTKLGKLYDKDHEGQPESVHNWAQCVHLTYDAYDEFCEDQISYLVETENHFQSLTQEDLALIKADFTGAEEILKIVRRCNPFVSRRKEILDCLLIKESCNEPDGSSDCIETLKIVPKVTKCENSDVCRMYDGGKNERMKMAKCYKATEAICFDRFWQIYYQDMKEQLKQRADIVKSSDDNIPSLSETSSFKFCDSESDNQQLECIIEWNVYALDQRPFESSLSETERETLADSLRTRFPNLYKDLYEKSTISDIRFEIDPKSVTMLKHFCPAENVQLKDILLGDDDYIDGDALVSGSKCTQLSETLSRCLPPPTIDIKYLKSVETKESAETEVTQTSQLAFLEAPGEYLGYCAGRSTPGQYCVPGWPDVGVLCPAGKLIECERPIPESYESESDFNESIERCIQRFGEVPQSDSMATDPFRRNDILDINGQPLSVGWWAACSKNVEDLAFTFPTDLESEGDFNNEVDETNI